MKELEVFKTKYKKDLNINIEHLNTDVENIIYKVSSQIFEYLESQQIIHGNGHHKAQNICIYALKILKKSYNKKYIVGINE